MAWRCVSPSVCLPLPVFSLAHTSTHPESRALVSAGKTMSALFPVLAEVMLAWLTVGAFWGGEQAAVFITLVVIFRVTA